MVLALEFLQTHRHGDGIVPVTQLLMNDQELCQSRLFEIAVITQLFPECFGPIEQSGSQKVTGQLLQGKLTLLTGQLTGDQVLVDLDGAIDLAPLTEQVAEGEVGFDGFAVDFQQLDKEIHRLGRKSSSSIEGHYSLVVDRASSNSRD